MNGTYLNLYEFKGKRYSNIQTIRPYNLKINIIGIFDNTYYIKKYIELKNGDIAILDRGFLVSFYKKNKKSKKFSYLNQYNEDEENLDSISDIYELDDNQYCLNSATKIKFLDWNKKIITNTIEFGEALYSSFPCDELLLMDKKDLLVFRHSTIYIIDIQKKEIIKKINIYVSGYFSCIYKVSDNIVIAGFWNNCIGQLEYDKNTKNLKLISNIGKKRVPNSGINEVSSISFKNNIFVFPYNNNFNGSSLIIYQLKNKYYSNIKFEKKI